MIPSPRLLRLLACGLVVAALPVLLHPWTWVLLAVLWGVVAVLVLVDAWSLLDAVPGFAVILPNSVGVGETVAADVRIVPRATRRVALTLRCETVGSLDAGDDVDLVTEGRPLALHGLQERSEKGRKRKARSGKSGEARTRTAGTDRALQAA